MYLFFYNFDLQILSFQVFGMRVWVESSIGAAFVEHFQETEKIGRACMLTRTVTHTHVRARTRKD